MYLKFKYRGTKLPTEEMVYFMSQNKEEMVYFMSQNKEEMVYFMSQNKEANGIFYVTK